jgi:predicted nucleotidyltransferase
MTLEEIKKVAMPACREFKVKRLDLFGSLARGEQAAESDVDLLVEFEEPDRHLQAILRIAPSSGRCVGV